MKTIVQFIQHLLLQKREGWNLDEEDMNLLKSDEPNLVDLLEHLEEFVGTYGGFTEHLLLEELRRTVQLSMLIRHKAAVEASCAAPQLTNKIRFT